MATTKYVLEKIKIESELHDIIAKTDGDNTTVSYKGGSKTLTAALADILASINGAVTEESVTQKINDAIDDLIGGAPATYDTLKEIADYIENHQSAADALNEAIGKKVDKVDGKGLSAEDFTTALKQKLESLPVITSSDVTKWNAKADATNATQSKNGLMSATDKKRLDNLRGVRYGTEPPEDMLDGELFVRVVSGT